MYRAKRHRAVDTSRDCYISLYSALNVPDPEGNTGDCNPVHLKPEHLKICGHGYEIDTLHHFENYGVFNVQDQDEWTVEFCKQYWGDFNYPIYVANHVRAALDLLYVDFVIDQGWGRGDGLSVDLPALFDREEDIRLVLEKFSVVIACHRELRQKWQDYCDWVWQGVGI